MPARVRRSRSSLTLAAALSMVATLAGCGGDKDPTPPAPPSLASITIVQKIDTLMELDSRQLTLSGLDNRGQPMAPTGVQWSSSDTSIVTVDAGGTVVAVQPGSATLQARSGSISTAQVVRVVGVPVRGISMRLLGGIASDTIMVGTTATLIADARDINGRLLRSRPITIESLDTTLATIDATGKVTARGVGYAMFAARHDTVTRQSRFAVRPPFAAKIAMRFLDPKKLGDTTWMGLRDSILVTFSDSTGRDLLTSPLRPVTYASDNPLVATVDPYGKVALVGTGTATIRATGERLTVARALTVVRGPITDVLGAPDTVRVLPGETTLIRPIIIDGGGVRVTALGTASLKFETATPSILTVDAQGMVRGEKAGLGAVRVSVGTGTVTVPVRVLSAPGEGKKFRIELRFVGPKPSAEVEEAFTLAKARWENVIRESTGTSEYLWRSNSCEKTDSTSTETITDVVIMARIDSIDGPSNILGSAGPCVVRRMPSGLNIPMIGRMRFDSADMKNMATAGLLQNVIAHEMGHVLGIGTMWTSFNRNGPALAQQTGFDPRYFGLGGIAASAGMGFTNFNIGTTGLPSLERVPLEDTGGSGTVGAHWRRSIFGNELMNGWAGKGLQPLSLLTVSAMADMGYAVSTSAAEAWGTFIIGGPSQNLLARYLGTQSMRIQEVLEEPEFALEPGGRVRRLRAPR